MLAAQHGETCLIVYMVALYMVVVNDASGWGSQLLDSLQPTGTSPESPAANNQRPTT
jgi:hypothetical protein